MGLPKEKRDQLEVMGVQEMIKVKIFAPFWGSLGIKESNEAEVPALRKVLKEFKSRY